MSKKTVTFFLLMTHEKDRVYSSQTRHFDNKKALINAVDYIRKNAPEQKIVGAVKRTIVTTDEEVKLD